MIQVVLLAAGKGTRMKSDMPKVLQPVNGTPIIMRLLKSVEEICPKPVLIVGHKAEEVMSATDYKYTYVLQKEQLGTGHAILTAKETLKNNPDIETILVLPGDHPLVKTETLEKLIEIHTKSGATVTLGTTLVEEYAGTQAVFSHFGRIIRDVHGNVDHIIEFKDAKPEERDVKEVNVSYYCFNAKWLWENIEKLGTTNVSKEYYITDMIGIAKSQGRQVDAFVFGNTECMGINTLEELRKVEEILSAEANAKSLADA